MYLQGNGVEGHVVLMPLCEGHQKIGLPETRHTRAVMPLQLLLNVTSRLTDPHPIL